MKTLLPAILLAATLLAASPARAQCFGGDGFSVPGACCVTVLPTLPQFPAITQQADGACFLDCAVEAVFPATIALGGPVPLFCDLYIIPISITGPAGVSSAPTIMIGKYLRTWDEVSPVVARQVWRFQVNTDLTYTAPFVSPCPTPVCASAANLPVHFVGHLDYARDCGTIAYRSSLAMAHMCGDYAHGALSGRPTAASHPSRLFAFAAPTPFLFGAPMPTPTGPVIADAVRSARTNLVNLQWDCVSEVPVHNGFHALIQNACNCSSSAGAPPRWEHTDLKFTYDCIAPTANSYAPLAWPGLAPTGLTWYPLGTWGVPPFVFPGNEAVSIGFGAANAPDVCANNFPFHIVYGSATHGGDVAILPTGVGTIDFIDLVNSMMLIPPPPYVAIGYGALYVSTMVWSLNF